MSEIKHDAFDEQGRIITTPDAEYDHEDARCSNCQRRVKIGGPYALCGRCADELYKRPEQ